MEYLIRSEEPFEQLEARVVGALGRHDVSVQRSFSLHSATQGEHGLVLEADDGPPGFSVFWLYSSGARRQPLALVTLYQRQGRTFFRAVSAVDGRPSPDGAESADLAAGLVAALVLDGLEVCTGLDGRRGCVDAAQVADVAAAERHRSPLQGGRSLSEGPGGNRPALEPQAE